MAPILRIQYLHGLGEVLSQRGKLADARAFFSEADALMASTEDVPPAVRAYHEGVLGAFEDGLGRSRDARLHFERQIAIIRGMKPVPEVESASRSTTSRGRR